MNNKLNFFFVPSSQNINTTVGIWNIWLYEYYYFLNTDKLGWKLL